MTTPRTTTFGRTGSGAVCSSTTSSTNLPTPTISSTQTSTTTVHGTHRMFYWANSKGVVSEVELADELQFVLDKIQLVPQNISSWTYLRGLQELAPGADQWNDKLVQFATSFIANVFSLPVDSPQALPRSSPRMLWSSWHATGV